MTIQKKSDEIRLFFEVALNKETTQKISEMLSDTYYSFITNQPENPLPLGGGMNGVRYK